MVKTPLFNKRQVTNKHLVQINSGSTRSTFNGENTVCFFKTVCSSDFFLFRDALAVLRYHFSVPVLALKRS